MKKIFHRKKDEENDKSPEHTRARNDAGTDPTLQSSLYESTQQGATPQTGEHAIKGTEDSIGFQQSSRSKRSSGNHDTAPYRLPTPHRTPPPPAHVAGPGHPDPHQQAPALPTEEFSGLSLGDEQSPTTVTQTATAPRGPVQGSFPPRSSSQAQGYNNHDNVGIRMVNQDGYQQTGYDGAAPSEADDANLGRQISIPRKQVGTSANAPQPSVQSPGPSSRQQGHNRNQSASKPLPAAPGSSIDSYEPRREEAMPQSSSVLDRSRPIPRGVTGPRDAQHVVERANSNTYDTDVIEKVAPAVVHETVHKKVHHVREEQITRETHNYDVYHRILPVVDVEVLPPRHFLPVEGGGLVEVLASEVPGRGNNWVIAETASKIPSDQSAPQGARQFTAREFPGHEGDARRYTAPDGHEVTEQTWVHPPELETGARDTGQSWPLELGDESMQKASHKHTSSKSGKRKSHRKDSVTRASPAQRADAVGRGV